MQLSPCYCWKLITMCPHWPSNLHLQETSACIRNEEQFRSKCGLRVLSARIWSLVLCLHFRCSYWLQLLAGMHPEMLQVSILSKLNIHRLVINKRCHYKNWSRKLFSNIMCHFNISSRIMTSYAHYKTHLSLLQSNLQNNTLLTCCIKDRWHSHGRPGGPDSLFKQRPVVSFVQNRWVVGEGKGEVLNWGKRTRTADFKASEMTTFFAHQEFLAAKCRSATLF